MDLCFEVTSNMFDLLYIEGYWINMGYVKSWYIDKKLVTGTVQRKDEWEKCLDYGAKCLRYAKWEPL